MKFWVVVLLTMLMPLTCAEAPIDCIVAVSASTSACSLARSEPGFLASTTLAWTCLRMSTICSAALRATPMVSEAAVSDSDIFL